MPEQQRADSDLAHVVRDLMAERDRYRVALETIRDLEALDASIRPGPCSIGDTALAISRGLDQCQRVARLALSA